MAGARLKVEPFLYFFNLLGSGRKHAAALQQYQLSCTTNAMSANNAVNPISASDANRKQQDNTSSSDVDNESGLRPLEPARSGSLYLASTLSLPREILLVTVVCCAQITTQAGLCSVLAILRTIAEDFDIHSPGEESWLIAAYSLTVGSFILISGRLGDVFGYKKMMIIGYLWFSLWSLVCGLAAYRGPLMFTVASRSTLVVSLLLGLATRC